MKQHHARLNQSGNAHTELQDTFTNKELRGTEKLGALPVTTSIDVHESQALSYFWKIFTSEKFSRLEQNSSILVYAIEASGRYVGFFLNASISNISYEFDSKFHLVSHKHTKP